MSIVRISDKKTGKSTTGKIDLNDLIGSVVLITAKDPNGILVDCTGILEEILEE
jgi:hypothetical protein